MTRWTGKAGYDSMDRRRRRRRMMMMMEDDEEVALFRGSGSRGVKTGSEKSWRARQRE